MRLAHSRWGDTGTDGLRRRLVAGRLARPARRPAALRENPMPENISIRIDGEYVPAQQGQTILEVARAGGKYIPTLCYLAGTSSGGRLPPLHRGGLRRGTAAACLHHSGAGRHECHHQLRETDPVPAIAMEFLFSERNHQCAVCVSNNHCELQAMAQRLGVTPVRYPYAYPKLAVDLSHPRYVLDHNRCILCTRCVRVCDGGGRRACLGRQFARHPQHDCVRHEPALGAIVRVAPVAASACRSARPARWRRRDSPWTRW